MALRNIVRWKPQINLERIPWINVLLSHQKSKKINNANCNSSIHVMKDILSTGLKVWHNY